MFDRGYSVTYYILCVIALFVMMSTSLVIPLISIFAKQVGASGVTIGLVVAGYWISRIFLEIPSGFISQRLGYYRTMMMGIALTIAGTVICAFVTTPIQLTLARALMGLGAPLFFAVATTLVINLFTSESRGTALGMFQGIEFVGTIVGATFSGYIVAAYDFKTSFLISAGLVCAALILIVVPRYVREESKRQVAAEPLSFSALREVLGNRDLLIVSSATFAEFIMSGGVLMTIFPLMANEELGFSLTSIGLLMGCRSIGYVIAMFSMGRISDRLGRRPVLQFGITATAALTLIMGMAKTFNSLAIIIFGIGISTGAIWIVSPVLAAESVKLNQRGAAIGTYRTFFDLGSIMGPIMMTYVMVAYGAMTCFYLASALLLVNLLPTTLLKKK